MWDHLKPRRQPRQERAKETVDVILEGMMDVLRRRDTSDPTVQAIADRAGVSVGSIYQYFPSKAALASGLIRRHLRQAMAEMEAGFARVAERGLTGRAAAEVLVDGLLDQKRATSRFELAVVRYFVRAGDLEALTAFDEQMYDIVVRFLAGQPASALRPVDHQLAAFLVCNALRTSVLLSLVQRPDQLASPGFRAELIELVVRYLSPDAAP